MDFFNANNVVKRFSNHLALDDVTIAVPEKSIFGLLGPNGAGKTTLIRIINQITAPDSGVVYLNGKVLRGEDVRRIGYLPEERGLYKKMKIGEQALYLVQLKGVSNRMVFESLNTGSKSLRSRHGGIRKWKNFLKGCSKKYNSLLPYSMNPVC